MEGMVPAEASNLITQQLATRVVRGDHSRLGASLVVRDTRATALGSALFSVYVHNETSGSLGAVAVLTIRFWLAAFAGLRIAKRG